MKSRIIATTIFVAVLLSLLVPAAPAAASAGAFVSKVNGLRASKGLPALSVNGSLASFAQSWTQKMANAGKISHNPSLSSAPGNWSTIGENVGVGGSVDSIFTALVNSSGHYKNMVNPKFNSIGVGVVTGSDGRLYTTHNFAAYPGAGSSSGTKTPATTAKPATTTANKSSSSSTSAGSGTTKSSTSQHNTNTESTPAPDTQTQAPTEPTQAPAPPPLPAPSDQIVQGLLEVGSMAVQG